MSEYSVACHGHRQKRRDIRTINAKPALRGPAFIMLLLSSTCRHYQASCFKANTRSVSLHLRSGRCAPYFSTTSSPISHLSSFELSLQFSGHTHSENYRNPATRRSFPWRHASYCQRQQTPRRRHSTIVRMLTNERVKAVLEGSSSSSSSLLQESSSGGGSSGSASSAVGRRPYPSLDDLDGLKVKELRLELSARGLETSGKRPELHSRLKAVLEIEAKEYENVSSEADTSIDSDNESSPSPAVDDKSSSTPSSSKQIVDPTSLDLDRPYILMVRTCFSSNLNGIGIGLALYTCDENGDENISSTKSSVVRGDEIWSGRVYLDGKRSMFEADYSGLIIAFDFATEVLKIRKLHLQVHNDVLVRQLEGKYKVNKPQLKTMLEYFYDHEDKMLSSSAMDYVEVSQFISNESPTVLAQAQDALAKRRSFNLLSDEWQIGDPLEIASSTVVDDDPISTEDVADDVVDREVEEVSAESPPPVVLPKEEQQERQDSDHKDSIPVVTDDTTIDPSKLYLLQFDGGSRGNPGIAAAGMVLYEINNQDDAIMEETRNEIWCGWKFHSDNATNNVAEYLGLLCGLKCAKSLGIRHLHVEGDSQLIARHINGEYRCREKHLRYFYDAAIDIINNDFDTFEIRHIRRKENSRADWLANHAMDTQESGGFVSEI